MDMTLFPTKGNLIIAKNALKLSRQGYDLLDKKRNILIREMMLLIDRAQDIQSKINNAYKEAYAALQNANISMGISRVMEIAECIDVDDTLDIKYRSVMGVEIPEIERLEKHSGAGYDLFNTSSQLDVAYVQFTLVKELTVELAAVENSVYRLAENIKKTQKRANSLKNVNIPKYEEMVSSIINYLEEKEREEFTRLKVIKHQNEQKES